MFGLKHLRSRLGGVDSATRQVPALAPVEILVAVESHVGRVRTVNEDAVFIARPTPAEGATSGSVLALVADGMGGSEGGEVASRIASECISRLYLSSARRGPKALRSAIQGANAEIHSRAQQNQALRGMGTTCVVLAIDPPIAWAAWVGDSRLYLIREGKIFQMTQDHSVVQEMVRRGMLSPEQAAAHEERNLVTRALGCHPKVDVAVWDDPFALRQGDRFLLSTDGLHDLLPDPDLLEIVRSASIDVACAGLIAEANRRGGHDNISAVLVEVAEPRSSGARLLETRQATVTAADLLGEVKA